MTNAYTEYLEERFNNIAPLKARGAPYPFIQQTLGRRTIGRYTKQVSCDNLLDLIKASALSTSSKSDFQQVSILHVTAATLRQAIGRLFAAMSWIGDALGFFVFLGNTLRLQQLGELRGKPVNNRNMEGFLSTTVDAALALQPFILRAESAGLERCSIIVIWNRIDEVAALLGSPDQVFPVAGVCVDYGGVGWRCESAPAAPNQRSLQPLLRRRSGTAHRQLRPTSACPSRFKPSPTATYEDLWRR